mgnify:CR=1 FL=1
MNIRGQDEVNASTISLTELPPIHLYPHLKTGYRPLSRSLHGSLKSILQIHNETINIWTHLAASFSFIYFLGYCIFTTSGRSRIFLCLFCSGAICCFIMSTVYHIFKEYNTSAATILSAMDWCGVCVLIAASHYLIAYNEFKDEPLALYVFISIVSVLGILTARILYKSITQTQQHASSTSYMYRTLVCILFSLMGFIMWVVHGCMANFAANELWQTLPFLAIMYVFHATALFCVASFPEKYFTPHFDVFGASHQFMHVGVVLGAMTLLQGSLQYHSRE